MHPVLGMDFLQEMGAIIDFRNGILKMGDGVTLSMEAEQFPNGIVKSETREVQNGSLNDSGNGVLVKDDLTSEYNSTFKIAGPHAVPFEAYYEQLDPTASGKVGAVKAAAFLKRSNLSDVILSKVWDLSDPKGNGYLDKHGVFVALKLISIAQIGLDVSLSNLLKQIPLPKMSERGESVSSVSDNDWFISTEERTKYNQLFNSLEPINERLPGNRVKAVMINSKLPVDVLGKIWDLSDIDNDGFLDRDEFVIGMHLIYKALENFPVPSSLPPSLLPATKRKKSLPGSVPVLPASGQARASPTPSVGSVSSTDSSLHMTTPLAIPWVVSAVDKAKYDNIFKAVDLDSDGFVTGGDVKNTFLQSGLSQAVLAHIWTLCDVNSNGRLNSEQFALAMFLINQKILGCEIPSALTLEMTPPSLLPKPGSNISNDQSKSEISETNKELQIISKEIEDLLKDKIQLEQDIAQKEADIIIRNGEVSSLQNMLNSLSTTLKQLDLQKGEAQKRLDDLDTQQKLLEKDMSEIQNKVGEEHAEVNRLKAMSKEQEESMTTQETQLNSKRQELNDLRLEESKLQDQVETGKTQLEGLNKTLQDTHLQITQTKSKISQVQESYKQINDLLVQYDSAISSGDVSVISELSQRTVTPTFSEQDYHRLSNTVGSSPVSSIGAFNMGGMSTGLDMFDDFKDEDPFKNQDPFTNGFGANVEVSSDDPFKSEDPFRDQVDNEDPFQETSDSKQADPFGGSDPFADNAFSVGADRLNGSAKPDSFDPFGLSSSFPISNANSKISESPFDGDPFGPPPVAPRSESPTPALPPKKSKAPPPRPAPPKGIGSRGPIRAAPPAPDPFFASPTESNQNSNNFDDQFASAFDSGNKTSSAFGASSFGVSDDTDPFKSTDSRKNSDPFSGTGEVDAFANFADFDQVN
ncbi:Epidermal growth factor receptor substrate 15-like 1 [Nymphon striatum]|nr:Epidermal growth factor receptor substrate 15-like 1 [Nymphon striatum]